MGNHDYFGDGEPLVALLRARGVSVLRNERRALARGAERAHPRRRRRHVEPPRRRRRRARRARRGSTRSSRSRTIPSSSPSSRAGARRWCSPDTRTGARSPCRSSPTRYNLSRLSYRHHAGLYRSGAATLYVSPGLGTTGPPLRLGAAPEITVLRLRGAPAEDRSAARQVQ